MEQDDYLNIIEQFGFKNVQNKKSRRIELPDELLTKDLDNEEIISFKKNVEGIFSITFIIGYKPKA